MLKYYLEYNNGIEVAYRYYPEGGNLYGIVKVKKETFEPGFVVIAENDEYKTYAFQMISRIKEYIKQDNYQEEGIIAWG